MNLPPVNTLGLIFDAATVAAAAHAGQVRKVTGTSYILHPGRVAARATLLPNTSHEIVAAAWLHDVVEDTDVTITDIESRFGPAVAQIVYGLTNVYTSEAEPNLNRAARKRKELERLATQPPTVLQIKLLDRIDNLYEIDVFEDFTKTYMLESQALLDVTRGVAPALEEEMRTVMRGISAVRQRNKL
jgi:(p)ppGpp synthase/HD superfamily hydrolase